MRYCGTRSVLLFTEVLQSRTLVQCSRAGPTRGAQFSSHVDVAIRDIGVNGVTRCGFFFSSRRRHTRYWRDWSSDVCSSDLGEIQLTLSDFTFNGSSLKLRGICKHQETEYSANAVSDAELIADWDNIQDLGVNRSEERRVGKEGRSRGSPYH